VAAAAESKRAARKRKSSGSPTKSKKHWAPKLAAAAAAAAVATRRESGHAQSQEGNHFRPADPLYLAAGHGDKCAPARTYAAQESRVPFNLGSIEGLRAGATLASNSRAQPSELQINVRSCKDNTICGAKLDRQLAQLPAISCYDYGPFGSPFALLMDSLRSMGARSGQEGAAKQPQAAPAPPATLAAYQRQLVQLSCAPNVSSSNFFTSHQLAGPGAVSQTGARFPTSQLAFGYLTAAHQKQLLAEQNLCLSPTCSSNQSNLSSPSASITPSSSLSMAQD